jgi:hypothetical protein
VDGDRGPWRDERRILQVSIGALVAAVAFGLTVSRDETHNTGTYTLIQHLTTFPTGRTEVFQVTDGDGPVPITVVRPGRSPDEPDEVIGTFHFDLERSDGELEIAVEADANATVGLVVTDMANR